MRIYASEQVHSSIDRAAWITGMGEANLVRIPTGGRRRSMVPDVLEAAIIADRADGMLPAGIIASVGGTQHRRHRRRRRRRRDRAQARPLPSRRCRVGGLGDDLPGVQAFLGRRRASRFHRPQPAQMAGAQFDCSAHFIRDPESLVRTLAIHPEYLRTHGRDGIVNYSEWSVPLGRRFRALKLWFLIRAHGLNGLRTMIRNHVRWSEALAARLTGLSSFEIVTEPMLSLFSFRHRPPDGRGTDEHNLALLDAINDDGRTYLTRTRVDGRLALRFQTGQFDTTEADLDTAFAAITELAASL